MSSIKSFFLLCIFVLLAPAAFAQQGKINKAKKLIEAFNYQEAIEILLQVLEKHDDSEAKMFLADCYRMVRNPHEMEYWYGQVAMLPQSPPITLLYYAQALQMNGKYKKASEWAKKYIELNPGDIRAQLLLKACEEDMVQNLRSSGALYKVEVREELSSPGDDFGPSFFGKDKLVFVSTKDKVKGTIPTKVVRDNWTNDGFAKMFKTDMRLIDEKTMKYKYSSVDNFSDKIQRTQHHIGPITFSADGSSAYFSATDLDKKADSDDKSLRLKIYKVDKKGNSWTEPKGVIFNDEEYNVTHPAIAPDGTILFFASDMPGGFGGMDLYASYMENGRWSVPVNLGPTVNTEGDEAFPFIHSDGTLYFSSNGHIGMGGFDIYYSKENYGSWSDPINIGYPVNTSADDFSIALNDKKTHGYFASNREGGKGGDDIYSFTKLSVEVEILVFDKKTQMPIEAAEVYTPCSSVKSYSTNPDGKVFMEIALDKACDFSAEKPQYKPNTVRTAAKDAVPGEKIIIQIPLDMERVFDVGGQVIDGLSKKPVPDVLVRMKSDCEGDVKEMSALTDKDGYYEFLEIKEDCDFQIVVSKEGFTKASANFTTKNLNNDIVEIDLTINCLGGPDCPDADGCAKNFAKNCKGTGKRDAEGNTECMDPQGNRFYYDQNCDLVYEINSKGETIIYKLRAGVPRIVHIFYDFDRADIRADARPGLDSLVRLLKLFPDANVRFTSHTDARGTQAYNNRLSNRRAESVIRYLISNGIPKRRLKAKGMGEDVMINDCYDGIPCSEEQHQENRRTEFVVTGYDKSGAALKSIKDMKGVKIDRCNNCDGAPKVEGDTNLESNTKDNQ